MQFAKTQSLKILLIFQTKIIFHFRNKAYETKFPKQKFPKTLVNSVMEFFFRYSFFLVNLERKFYFLIKFSYYINVFRNFFFTKIKFYFVADRPLIYK